MAQPQPPLRIRERRTRKRAQTREVVVPGCESVTGHFCDAGPPRAVGETLVLIDEDAVLLAGYLLLQRQPRVLEGLQRVLGFGKPGVEQLDGFGQLTYFSDDPECVSRMLRMYIRINFKKLNINT